MSKYGKKNYNDQWSVMNEIFAEIEGMTGDWLSSNKKISYAYNDAQLSKQW